MQSHVRKVHACLAVTCHLHFWQNDRDLLHATAVMLTVAFLVVNSLFENVQQWDTDEPGVRGEIISRVSVLSVRNSPPFSLYAIYFVTLM